MILPAPRLSALLRTLVPGLMLALAAAGCTDGDQASCTIATVADLPLIVGTHSPIVQASLDGRPVAMLIDTGASISIVTPAAADRFNLRPAEGELHTRLTGIGGSVDAPFVTLHHFVLGKGHSSNLELPVGDSVKGSINGVPLIGLFGADFLSNYDVDIDMPNHRFALRTLTRCGARIAPFAGAYFELPFHLEKSAIQIDVKVNGFPMPAILDSGASTTMINRIDARQLGLTADRLSTDAHAKTTGVGAYQLDTIVHRFASLEIGDEQLNNFRFIIAGTYTGNTLIGDEFFHHNHVWISYSRQMLYIQPAADDPLIHQAK